MRKVPIAAELLFSLAVLLAGSSLGADAVVRPGSVSADYERMRSAAFARMSGEEMAEAERSVMRTVCDMALVPPRLEMHPATNRYACRPIASAFHGYAINRRLAEIRMWKFAMNGGACGTRGGRLWRVWMAGEDGPEAYVVGARSDDLGKTWSEPLFVVDGHFKGDWCHGLALQRSNLFANLWTDPYGKMHLFLCQMTQIYDGRLSLWEFVCDDPDAKEIVWSEARYLWHGMPHNKPTVLKNGAWLLPVTLERDVNGLWPDLPRGCGALISKDEGGTWMPGGFARPEGTDHWCEHAFVELSDGRIKMVLRTGKGPMESYSADGGLTWSKPVSTSGWFRNPVARFQFMKLRSGCWLLVKNGDDRLSYDDNYGLSGSGRNKLKAYFSSDEGKTWGAPVVLDLRDSVAYPDACELADGSVYVSWEFDRRGRAEICGKIIRPLH